MKPTCEFCEYWIRNRPDHPKLTEAGDCRRYPPVEYGEDGLAKWPQALSHQHCGEWRTSGDHASR